jgi:hypothetical protein
MTMGLALLRDSTQLARLQSQLAGKLAMTLQTTDSADIYFSQAIASGKIDLIGTGAELVAGVVPLLQLATYACIMLHAPGAVDTTSSLQHAANLLCFHQEGRLDFIGFTELLQEYAKMTGSMRRFRTFEIYKPIATALGESLRAGAFAELGENLSWGTFVRKTMVNYQELAPDHVPIRLFEPELLHQLILRIDEFQTAVLRDQHLCGGSQVTLSPVRAVGPARPARTSTPPNPTTAMARSSVHFFTDGGQCWTPGCTAARKPTQNACPECNTTRQGTWACPKDLYLNRGSSCRGEGCTKTRADALPPAVHASVVAACLMRAQAQHADAQHRLERRDLAASRPPPRSPSPPRYVRTLRFAPPSCSSPAEHDDIGASEWGYSSFTIDKCGGASVGMINITVPPSCSSPAEHDNIGAGSTVVADGKVSGSSAIAGGKRGDTSVGMINITVPPSCSSPVEHDNIGAGSTVVADDKESGSSAIAGGKSGEASVGMINITVPPSCSSPAEHDDIGAGFEAFALGATSGSPTYTAAHGGAAHLRGAAHS